MVDKGRKKQRCPKEKLLVAHEAAVRSVYARVENTFEV